MRADYNMAVHYAGRNPRAVRLHNLAAGELELRRITKEHLEESHGCYLPSPCPRHEAPSPLNEEYRMSTEDFLGFLVCITAVGLLLAFMGWEIWKLVF